MEMRGHDMEIRVREIEIEKELKTNLLNDGNAPFPVMVFAIISNPNQTCI